MRKIIYGNVIFYGIGAIGWYLYYEYKSVKVNKISFIGLILKNPVQYSVIIIIGSYIQGLIHEFPNVFAKQWVYQNIPFIETNLLGIPIFAFLGWFYLTLFPVSVYHFILSRNKKL